MRGFLRCISNCNDFTLKQDPQLFLLPILFYNLLYQINLTKRSFCLFIDMMTVFVLLFILHMLIHCECFPYGKIYVADSG